MAPSPPALLSALARPKDSCSSTGWSPPLDHCPPSSPIPSHCSDSEAVSPPPSPLSPNTQSHNLLSRGQSFPTPRTRTKVTAYSLLLSAFQPSSALPFPLQPLPHAPTLARGPLRGSPLTHPSTQPSTLQLTHVGPLGVPWLPLLSP